jgi:predicted nucleic-acid-binding Zn-ribbon protein
MHDLYRNILYYCLSANRECNEFLQSRIEPLSCHLKNPSLLELGEIRISGTRKDKIISVQRSDFPTQQCMET